METRVHERWINSIWHELRRNAVRILHASPTTLHCIVPAEFLKKQKIPKKLQRNAFAPKSPSINKLLYLPHAILYEVICTRKCGDFTFYIVAVSVPANDEHEARNYIASLPKPKSLAWHIEKLPNMRSPAKIYTARWN